MDNTTMWLIIGFSGQALFSARFIIQYIKSEQQQKSVIPVAFWYFSLAGGITLCAYAIHKMDPVFIMGQSLGIFVYLRNLHFVQLERKRLKDQLAELSNKQ